MTEKHDCFCTIVWIIRTCNAENRLLGSDPEDHLCAIGSRMKTCEGIRVGANFFSAYGDQKSSIIPALDELPS